MTIRETIPLKATQVDLIVEGDNCVTITVHNGDTKVVYQVTPELKLKGLQATAVLSLDNVTPSDDEIPF